MWGGQSTCSSQALSQHLNVSKLIKFGSFAWGNSLVPCCRMPLMQKIKLRRTELCAETLSEVLQNRSKIFPSHPRPPERSSGNVVSLMTLNVHWNLNLWIYSLVGEKDWLFLSKSLQISGCIYTKRELNTYMWYNKTNLVIVLITEIMLNK